MKILSRISQLFRSNVNAALDRMSDPAKEIEHLIVEMEDELKKARIELRDQLAQVKLQEKRVDECRRNVQRYQEHAKRAVQAGDDNLALEALRHLKLAEEKAAEAERTLSEQSNFAAKMVDQIRQNDTKFAQIRARKETLKTQAKMGKQQLSSHESAFDRFEHLASQIELNEHQVEAMAEVASLSQPDKDRTTHERFDRLLGAGQEEELELEHRLQALKASMNPKALPSSQDEEKPA